MNKLLVTAALALGCSVSQAGVLGLGSTTFEISEATPISAAGGFLFTSSFNLASSQQVSFQLKGWSSASSDLFLGSLSLAQGGQSFTFAPGAGPFGFGAATLSSETVGSGRRATTTYSQSYDLAPLTLDAGEWTVSIAGRDELLKQLSGVSLSGTASAVSEPGALALSLLALVPLALVARRRAGQSA